MAKGSAQVCSGLLSWGSFTHPAGFPAPCQWFSLNRLPTLVSPDTAGFGGFGGTVLGHWGDERVAFLEGNAEISKTRYLFSCKSIIFRFLIRFNSQNIKFTLFTCS